MTYLDDLAQQLATAGVGGRRRRRIVAEFADHLACDPQADLGDPSEVARQFADQLGTRLALRAAYVSFAALALAGSLFAIDLVAGQSSAVGVPAAGRLKYAAAGSLAYAGAGLAIVACQVAFVTGGLAAVRALRRRHAGVIPRLEAGLIVRRAAVGLAAGLLTMIGLALVAAGAAHGAATWWRALVFASAGTGLLALLAAALPLAAAARLRPLTAGSAGDLREDLGPLLPPVLDGGPWVFALGVAIVVTFVIAVAGAAQADPFDGVLRGLTDGAACLVGFAALGRYLGLRT
jgi:hypothetical protein